MNLYYLFRFVLFLYILENVDVLTDLLLYKSRVL